MSGSGKGLGWALILVGGLALVLEVLGQVNDWAPALVLLLVIGGIVAVIAGLMIIIRSGRAADTR